MNRRYLAVIALLVALGLFAAPLVSPIPNQEPHVRVDLSKSKPDSFEDVKPTYRYQNLSDSAQHFFDTQVSTDDEPPIPLADVPAPWAPSDNVTARAIADAENDLQVVKHGRYYAMYLVWTVPQPPLTAVVPRFGALMAAIGLGTLAGYVALTAEG
jgi:hypothetical protein